MSLRSLTAAGTSKIVGIVSPGFIVGSRSSLFALIQFAWSIGSDVVCPATFAARLGCRSIIRLVVLVSVVVRGRVVVVVYQWVVRHAWSGSDMKVLAAAVLIVCMKRSMRNSISL